METAFREDVLRALNQSQMDSTPFPHLVLSDTFSAEAARDLVRNLPPADVYVSPRSARYAGTDRNRFEIWLTAGAPEIPLPLRPFWAVLHDFFNCAEVCRALLVVARSYIAIRCGGNWRDIQLRATLRLVQERGSVNIDPHVDSASTVMTWLIYLPIDESQANRGTSLYTHRGESAFHREKTVPYTPRTSLLMLRTSNAWHGAESEKRRSLGRRDMLQVFYEVRRGTFYNRPSSVRMGRDIAIPSISANTIPVLVRISHINTKDGTIHCSPLTAKGGLKRSNAFATIGCDSCRWIRDTGWGLPNDDRQPSRVALIGVYAQDANARDLAMAEYIHIKSVWREVLRVGHFIGHGDDWLERVMR